MAGHPLRADLEQTTGLAIERNAFLSGRNFAMTVEEGFRITLRRDVVPSRRGWANVLVRFDARDRRAAEDAWGSAQEDLEEEDDANLRDSPILISRPERFGRSAATAAAAAADEDDAEGAGDEEEDAIPVSVELSGAGLPPLRFDCAASTLDGGTLYIEEIVRTTTGEALDFGMLSEESQQSVVNLLASIGVDSLLAVFVTRYANNTDIHHAEGVLADLLSLAEFAEEHGKP